MQDQEATVLEENQALWTWTKGSCIWSPILSNKAINKKYSNKPIMRFVRWWGAWWGKRFRDNLFHDVLRKIHGQHFLAKDSGIRNLYQFRILLSPIGIAQHKTRLARIGLEAVVFEVMYSTSTIVNGPLPPFNNDAYRLLRQPNNFVLVCIPL